jgi:Tol biopolymer transport system component
VVTTHTRAYIKTEVHVIDVANAEDRIVYAGEDVQVEGLTWAPDNSRLVVQTFRAQEPGPDGEDRNVWEMRSVSLAGAEDQVLFAGLGPRGHPAYSRTGRLAYFAGWTGDPSTGIHVNGRLVHPLIGWDIYSYLSWAPDGQQLVFTGPPTSEGLRRVTLADGSLTQLLGPVGDETISNPAYSPDGERIAVVRFGSDPYVEEIWTAAADGTGPQRLTEGTFPVWTPDGAYLAVVRYGSPAGVYVIPPTGSAAVRVIGVGDSRWSVQALSWSW